MPLLCHLAAWKLNKTTFGFADRSRAELQELMPQPKPKKQKVEVATQRTTRSQAREQTLQHEDQCHKDKEEAAEKWKRITEEHCKEKEAEEKRCAKQQEEGKAKVQEEEQFQDIILLLDTMPEKSPILEE